MKKVALLLALILTFSAFLVSCGDDTVIGDPNHYPDYQPPVTEELEINLYIICDSATTDNAKKTVAGKIKQFTKDKFHTAVNVIYRTEAEYLNSVKEAVNGTDANPKADIVLINSKSLMDYLMTGNKLADITELVTKGSYGTLNAQITASLINASKIDGKLYSVPNNRVVGEYEYILIDKQKAKDLFCGTDDIAQLITYEAAKEYILSKLSESDKGNIDNYVKRIFAGKYEDKAAYEADGWYCNIASYPTVDANDAFASAFAVMAGTADVARMVQIIYAINTNVELRNLLQYGIAGTNYLIVNGDIVPNADGNNVYRMNIEYTGDVFKAAYSEFYGWTESVSKNGVKQNLESSAK